MTDTGGKSDTQCVTDSEAATSATRPVITFDYERYAHFLEDDDLTDEQKRELLETLWNIIVNFVSLGFGVHPLDATKLGSAGGQTKAAIRQQSEINGSDIEMAGHKALFADAAKSAGDSADKGVKY